MNKNSLSVSTESGTTGAEPGPWATWILSAAEGFAVGKRERHFDRVAEYKERFRRLSTEMIRHRLSNFGTALYKEAAIALRELLEEREAESPASGEPDAAPGTLGAPQS